MGPDVHVGQLRHHFQMAADAVLQKAIDGGVPVIDGDVLLE
jgi:hypothetical protein